MGGSTQTTTAQESKKIELPAWVNEASQSNYQRAQQVANRPLEQYQGERVAAPSDMTNQGYGMLRSGAGAETGMFDDAANIYKRTSGPMDINPYLNPYTDEVEKRAIGNANTAIDQQLLGVTDKASKAGAFGGSRAAVESGVTRAEGARGIGDLSAQLRAQGFDVASRNALADRSGMQASAAGLGNIAGAKQGARLSDAGSLLSAGQAETGSRQKVIDANMGKFDEARNYPVEQLNLLLASLGMSPYGKTETGTKNTQTETPMDWATTLLGLGNIGLSAYKSDRNSKTDITKLTDGDIPIYSYRYKEDPKSYPKVVGPMAQDIEKKYPSAVKKVGKYKVVDLNNLMEVLK
jgi:hypothetical protein